MRPSSKLLSPRRGHGNPQLTASQLEVGEARTCNWLLGRRQSYGMEPFSPVGSVLTPGSWCQKCLVGKSPHTWFQSVLCFMCIVSSSVQAAREFFLFHNNWSVGGLFKPVPLTFETPLAVLLAFWDKLVQFHLDFWISPFSASSPGSFWEGRLRFGCYMYSLLQGASHCFWVLPKDIAGTFFLFLNHELMSTFPIQI